MRLWCSHKWGKIQEDGFQYCEHCGKAISPNCSHKWKRTESYKEKFLDKTQRVILVMECQKCGDIKTVEIE